MPASSVIILGLWWFAVAANGCLAIARLRPWLWRRYPLFAFWIAYQLIVSVVLLWAGGKGQPHPYSEIWKSTQWISAGILAGVTVEAYRALLRRIAEVQKAARGLFGLLAVICGVVSLGIGALDRPWLRAGNGAEPWMVAWQHATFTLA